KHPSRTVANGGVFLMKTLLKACSFTSYLPGGPPGREIYSFLSVQTLMLSSRMVVRMIDQIDFRPVILAGGSGTRFWPRSRRAHAKQVLALDGERSMIQQTVERLKPLASLEKTWIITNEYLAREIADQLPGLPASQIVQEPVARNTAPACGLAAFLIERESPDAVLGVFPSDHV